MAKLIEILIAILKAWVAALEKRQTPKPKEPVKPPKTEDKKEVSEWLSES